MSFESAATLMSEVEETTPPTPVERSEPDFPLPPESLEQAGMSESAVMDLILKTLYSRSAQQGRRISEILALRFTLLDDIILTLQQMQLVEVRGSHGHGREGYTFAITEAGIVRAREANGDQRVYRAGSRAADHFHALGQPTVREGNADRP